MDQATEPDPRSNSPQTLSTPWPRMTPEMRLRVERRLVQGCWCGAATATLKKRNQSSYIAVWLQCDGCGKGHGEAFRRADHFAWQAYPLWDDTLRETFNQRYRQKLREDGEVRAKERLEAWRTRSKQYHEWCRTSPEWHAVVERILRRSGRRCEACLQAEATTAHHLTYAQGVLPPAWQLRSVCQACHDRLHADQRGEDDEWSPQPPVMLSW